MKKDYVHVGIFILYLVFLLWLRTIDFLTFHMLLEFTSMMFGFALYIIFFIAYKRDRLYFPHIVTVGLLLYNTVLLMHTFTFEGMNLLSNYGENQSSQLWLIANFVLVATLIIAALHNYYRFNAHLVGWITVLVTGFLILLVAIGVFPDVYTTSVTTFKRVMEFLIIIGYASAVILLAYDKEHYSNIFLLHFIVAVAFLGVSEMSVLISTNITGRAVAVGHILRLSGIYILLLTVLKEYFTIPYETAYTDLSNELTMMKASFKETERNADIFRALYNDAPLGYQSLDINGNFIIVNDTYARLLGYKKEEMIGRNFEEFLSDEGVDLFHTNFPLFKKLGTADVIFNMVHKNGNLIPVRFLGKIAYKGDGDFKQTHCILMDISNEIEYQKGIIESKERLEDIMNLTAEGIFTIDQNGLCTSINSRALDILEASIEDVIHKKMYATLQPQYLDGTSVPFTSTCGYQTIQGGDCVTNTTTIIWTTLKGNHVEVLVEAYPIFNNDTIIGATISFRDKSASNNIVNSLVKMSYHDSLTGLFNRRYFEEEIKHIDNNVNLPLSIIVADINGLKLVNDAFGHHSGDQLLLAATEVFIHNSSNRDFIARIGGDEFIIVMPQTNAKDAHERITKMTNEARSYQVKSVQLSISFGTSTKKTNSEDFDEIYKDAEDAMYRMKLLDVPSMRSTTIDTIVRTLYEKDAYSETHSRSVSRLAEGIATKYRLSFQQVNEIRMAGILHDIGKIIIPKHILDKKGRLSEEEYLEVKKHPEIGFRILNSSTELRQLSEIVLSHHEWWDGNGYPRGLKGEQIPLLSRIICVADAFDAMTSERTYRETKTVQQAIEELKRCKGSQFDPDIVDVFCEHHDTILRQISSPIYKR